MFRAIVWKELREQGLIGLTLTVLGSGVLAGVAAFADPPAARAGSVADIVRSLGPGPLATLMLAVTAGMVCGGAVFAAEREAGTMGFLESLPCTRRRLWLAKLAAGFGLAFVQVVLLVAVGTALGLVPSSNWAGNVLLSSLLAFVWGVFGSTAAQTTLGSVGLAIPAASLTAFLAAVPVFLFFSPTNGAPRPSGTLFFLLCMVIVPLLVSLWLFTALDRNRAADAQPTSLRGRFGVVALLWLGGREVQLIALALSAFAIVAGFGLLSPTMLPLTAWPPLALMAGVLAGVTAFADEQTRGASRFWSEQRLPLGRAWIARIALHLLLGVWLLLLLAIPLIVRSQNSTEARGARGHSTLSMVFQTYLFDELGRNGWKYLVVPAVYGFAAGHLCGLLFRKLVVACGVAGIIGGVCGAVWLPSLLAGGVHQWQLWLPPLFALLTARLLMPAWAAGRLTTRGPLTTLACGVAAVLLALGIGIAYRMLELPDKPDGDDDLAFVQGLLPFDRNYGGRDLKMASERYARLASATAPEYDRASLGLTFSVQCCRSVGVVVPDYDRPSTLGASTVGSRRPRVEERLDAVSRTGWPTYDPVLIVWLARVFEPTGSDDQTWYALLEQAAAHPPGVFEYPQLVSIGSNPTAVWENARRMNAALVARGLQQQAAGDSTAFVAAFQHSLLLAQTLRNGAGVTGLETAMSVERAALGALDRWLERLPDRGPRDEFLAIGTALEQLDPKHDFDPTPHFLADRHVLREAMKGPAQWLTPLITPPGAGPETTTREVDLVALAWAMPWERERTRRLVGLGFESGRPGDYRVVAGRPGSTFLLIRHRTPGDLIESDRLLRSFRRASLLKVALRAHLAEHGNFPPTLAALRETGYIRSLPADPYDPSRLFNYRVSPGETLRPAPRPTGDRFVTAPEPMERSVPAGQAILWSVGPDRLDQGGINPPNMVPTGTNRPEDLVYLVPFGFAP